MTESASLDEDNLKKELNESDDIMSQMTIEAHKSNVNIKKFIQEALQFAEAHTDDFPLNATLLLFNRTSKEKLYDVKQVDPFFFKYGSRQILLEMIYSSLINVIDETSKEKHVLLDDKLSENDIKRSLAIFYISCLIDYYDIKEDDFDLNTLKKGLPSDEDVKKVFKDKYQK